MLVKSPKLSSGWSCSMNESAMGLKAAVPASRGKGENRRKQRKRRRRGILSHTLINGRSLRSWDRKCIFISSIPLHRDRGKNAVGAVVVEAAGTGFGILIKGIAQT